MKSLKSVTLEMSLKPFFSTHPAELENVCRTLFKGWLPLIRHADEVRILLWVSEGSEILDYTGQGEDEIEWCRYIGGANPRANWDNENDPEGKGLHTRFYLYTEDPVVFTNNILKQLISILKRTGREITGKPILVGETFDPGPEFAKSSFKYERHNEICIGESMGRSSMVCSYALLNGDNHTYATYPEGIPQGTPFGTFFGKQAQRFMTDIGFDYLWLSNGFGFGTETWGVTGATFNGNEFFSEKVELVSNRVIDFWHLFRQEFSLPVQTRGTNLTAGIDYSTDAVDLKQIYEGEFGILPPPNSPWAAMDSDFGLELAGYMSRIAELPADSESADSYMFRFYLHDPWWMNSPWIDRYDSQPHDIYLPLAVSRLDEQGQVHIPAYFNILTVDNSLGEMPENCINEMIPHVLNGYETAPDAAAPFVWVYPFGEYFKHPNLIEKTFFEEWFLIKAINCSLPLNTVISSEQFLKQQSYQQNYLKNSILVVPVPVKNSPMTDALISFVQGGGQVMLYGSLSNADEQLLKLLKIKLEKSLTGEFILETSIEEDTLEGDSYSKRIVYGNTLSDGGVDTVPEKNDNMTILASVKNNDGQRLVLTYAYDPAWNNGGVIWCRGYSCSRAEQDTEMYPLARLFTLAAGKLGYCFRIRKEHSCIPNPVITIHRHRHACWYSIFNPNTTTDVLLKTPLGAPLLIGCETTLKHGCALYRPSRAWRNECRVFVKQNDGGVLCCRERSPVSFHQRRKISVTGLNDADVYILPFDGDLTSTEVLANSRYPFLVGKDMDISDSDTVYGKAWLIKNVSGELQISNISKA